MTTFGAVGDGVHDDSAAFQKAVQAAVKDHGYVMVPQPKVSYRITHTVNLASGVVVTGAATKPTIIGGVAKSYVFRLSGLHGAGLSCLTMDLGHLTYASAVNVRASSDVTLSGLVIVDVTRGWGMNIGTPTPTSTAISNTDITVSDTSFSGFDSPFEQILLFNSSHVTISQCHFGSAALHSSGGGLGLYQNDDQVMVTGNTFGPSLDSTGSYYSVTVNDITFQNNTFIGNGSSSAGNTGIKGANSSDHGLFGQTTADNYTIIGNTFKGYRIALQLGAVKVAHVSQNTFASNDVAVEISDGNLYHPTLVRSPDSAVTIQGNTFTANGTGGAPKPGASPSTILFLGHGGDLGTVITGNRFTVAAGSSAPVVDLQGPYSWNGLSVSNNTFPGSDSQFLVRADGASLGPSSTATNN